MMRFYQRSLNNLACKIFPRLSARDCDHVLFQGSQSVRVKYHYSMGIKTSKINYQTHFKREIHANSILCTTTKITPAKEYGPPVSITFVEGNLEDGNRITVLAPTGKKLVDVALDCDVDIEAACGGELACSTCHCVFTDDALFASLPKKKEEEEDMLDLASGLQRTSRLSCQLEVNSKYEGAVILVPGEGI